MLEVTGALFATGIALYIILGMVYLALATTVFTGLKNSWPAIVIATVFSAGVVIGWWFLVGTHIHLEFS